MSPSEFTPVPPPYPRPRPAQLPATIRRKRAVSMAMVFIIIALSFVLSFDFASGTFLPTAGLAIFSGVLVAAILYIASLYAQRVIRVCPFCNRPVFVADAVFCPYCGRQL